MATRVAATPAGQGGEETARLYEQYGDQLYRYCVARLRSRTEAEDAVQSVWVRVHGALLKGVTPRFEAAWLYKIAHNVCLSRRESTSRLAKHEETIDPAELDWALAAYDAKPDELFALPAALAEMPKKLRDPFLLREWQGLSYAEIAEALDTTVSAVETLIFRARRHLAAALEPPEEKRSLTARVLDLGWLYGAVRIALAQARGLLGITAPAKLATGAAVVAVGGVGVEQAVVAAAADHPRDRTPAVVHARTLPSNGVVRPHVPGVVVARPAVPRPVETVFPAPKKPAAPATRAASTPTTPRGAPAALPAPVEEHAQPVSEPASPAAAPPPAVTSTATAAPITTTPKAPPTTIPPVETPAVTVPAVTVPAVTVPVPPVPVPTVTVPTVTVPSVTVPSVTVPTVTVTVPTLP